MCSFLCSILDNAGFVEKHDNLYFMCNLYIKISVPFVVAIVVVAVCNRDISWSDNWDIYSLKEK